MSKCAMDPIIAAQELYDQVITRAGYPPPQEYAELLAIVEAQDAPPAVVDCRDAPDDFTGVQMNDVLFINGQLADRQRMRILAHEFGHWLRRRQARHALAVSLYQGGRTDGSRDYEEKVAKAFELLF